ncbi:MAG TPA: DUF58 domain-containing protein [Terriglobales bacterium]|nr:DUF58 domain-containing protein [Terriglobales bacterium]
MGVFGLLSKLDRGAWFRFFIALGGLTLAMTSAMYSTLFQREGNLLATAIAASVALLTAGWVGLYTVPYLAKRAALEGMREAFDYDVTTEGLVYLGTALLVGVAALNTGNNMLFIIVAAMLSAIAVSGAASALVLRALRLEATLPAHVFAMDAVMARVVLRNRFFVSSFSVSVVPPRERKSQGWHWERGEFVWPPKRAAGKEWIRWKDWKLRPGKTEAAADAIFRGAVYFPYVAARQSAYADLELNFPRRGRYVQDGFGLATRFPFSFLVKTRRISADQELIAYPSVQPTDEFFSVLPMITGEFEAFVRGRGYELYRIREHMPEDSARLVDWKATAKSGALKVREFTREDERKLRIVFDNPAPGAVSDNDYEAAVALTASLAWHFAGTNTQLSFAAHGYEGSGNVLDFLRFLALVEPRAEAEALLPKLRSTGDYNLIITAQTRGSVPTELWASSYIVFMDKAK